MENLRDFKKLQPQDQTPKENQGPLENKKSRVLKGENFLPFRLLPDVKEASIISSYVDPLFECFGVKRNRNKANIRIIS
jgi:hypothetical protein